MSEEWGSLSPERLGKVTASRIADVMATAKGGFGVSRERYRAELVCERRTGISASKDIGYLPAVKWGQEHEPIARSAYEFERMATVDFAGFVIHPRLPHSGCSPDGFVGADGLIEIKCPELHTHYAYLVEDKTAKEVGRAPKLPEKYLQQMQFQMACTGRQWCDFVSFDPRWREDALLISRVQRDDTLIKKIEDAVSLFLNEVDAGVSFLRKRNGGGA